ncbi:hypothetical protein [Streptomyces sp. NPDC047108]|uniref:hypothetical protein n=1 Tax=Streptomyces sp. NPDC047108 TaxID=3155025 RepID=UPI0033EFBAD0
MALPLPKGAEVSRAVTEGATLELGFSPGDGSARDALTAYDRQLAKGGYERHDGTWTRGKQTLDTAAEGDALQVTLTYPGQAPPLPEAPLLEVGSRADDTLRLTYGVDRNSSDSVSMAKSYYADLIGQGWEVPTDGGMSATKGTSTIEFDSTDPERAALTIDVPASSAR